MVRLWADSSRVDGSRLPGPQELLPCEPQGCQPGPNHRLLSTWAQPRNYVAAAGYALLAGRYGRPPW